jgi:hypothetical protein
MIRNIILITSLFYLISCTSSDQPVEVQTIKMIPPKPLKTSNPASDKESIQSFSTFLRNIATYQMVAAGQTNLQEEVSKYLPDSTISAGFDLHLREIGGIDTFRLVFHEYFDLYDDWSKAYLTVFSLEGKALQAKRLQELSFEGNTSINIIDEALIEIAYHDFFAKDRSPSSLVVLRPSIEEPKRKRRKKRKYESIHPNKVEGTIYEYYRITQTGILSPLSQMNDFSAGRNYPQASFRLLSRTELASLTKSDLGLIKSEMLAEHGYIFQDDNSAKHYQKQPWYKAQHYNVDSLLSDVERYNYQLLQQLEQDY